MTKIYIDTNVFLDFYQAASDRLKVFGELVSRASIVILPEQTVSEFRRNRSARLIFLAKVIEDKAISTLHTTSVVRELPEFFQWEKARKELEASVNAIIAHIRNWIHNEDSDPVLSLFNQHCCQCYKNFNDK